MKKDISDRIVVIFAYFILVIFTLICLYPLLLAFSVSVSDNLLVEKYGYSLIPLKLSLDAYRVAFNSNWIVSSYSVTLTVVIIGTLLSILISSMFAYTISVKTLKYRNTITLYCFFTMVFNVSLVPWYIVLIKFYGFGDSLWSLIIPYLINPWFIFLLRNYFESLPDSMAESAKIDGAGALTIFSRIIMPLSTPILATITLFVALVYWNDWWLALLFIKSRSLFPIQFQLFNILSNILFLTSGAEQSSATSSIKLPRETVKMATTIITIGPIIFLYPFIQKYFIKGIMIGAIKG